MPTNTAAHHPTDDTLPFGRGYQPPSVYASLPPAAQDVQAGVDDYVARLGGYDWWDPDAEGVRMPEADLPPGWEEAFRRALKQLSRNDFSALQETRPPARHDDPDSDDMSEEELQRLRAVRRLLALRFGMDPTKLFPNPFWVDLREDTGYFIAEINHLGQKTAKKLFMWMQRAGSLAYVGPYRTVGTRNYVQDRSLLLALADEYGFDIQPTAVMCRQWADHYKGWSIDTVMTARQPVAADIEYYDVPQHLLDSWDGLGWNERQAAQTEWAVQQDPLPTYTQWGPTEKAAWKQLLLVGVETMPPSNTSQFFNTDILGVIIRLAMEGIVDPHALDEIMLHALLSMRTPPQRTAVVATWEFMRNHTDRYGLHPEYVRDHATEMIEILAYGGNRYVLERLLPHLLIQGEEEPAGAADDRLYATVSAALAVRTLVGIRHIITILRTRPAPQDPQLAIDVARLIGESTAGDRVTGELDALCAEWGIRPDQLEDPTNTEPAPIAVWGPQPPLAKPVPTIPHLQPQAELNAGVEAPGMEHGVDIESLQLALSLALNQYGEISYRYCDFYDVEDLSMTYTLDKLQPEALDPARQTHAPAILEGVRRVGAKDPARLASLLRGLVTPLTAEEVERRREWGIHDQVRDFRGWLWAYDNEPDTLFHPTIEWPEFGSRLYRGRATTVNQALWTLPCLEYAPPLLSWAADSSSTIDSKEFLARLDATDNRPVTAYDLESALYHLDLTAHPDDEIPEDVREELARRTVVLWHPNSFSDDDGAEPPQDDYGIRAAIYATRKRLEEDADAAAAYQAELAKLIPAPFPTDKCVILTGEEALITPINNLRALRLAEAEDVGKEAEEAAEARQAMREGTYTHPAPPPRPDKNEQTGHYTFYNATANNPSWQRDIGREYVGATPMYYHCTNETQASWVYAGAPFDEESATAALAWLRTWRNRLDDYTEEFLSLQYARGLFTEHLPQPRLLPTTSTGRYYNPGRAARALVDLAFEQDALAFSWTVLTDMVEFQLSCMPTGGLDELLQGLLELADSVTAPENAAAVPPEATALPVLRRWVEEAKGRKKPTRAQKLARELIDRLPPHADE